MPQNVAIATATGQYVQVANVIWNTYGFQSITYPAAVNQPFPFTFTADAIIRITGGLLSKLPANGSFAILKFTVTDPNGNQKTIQTEVIGAGQCAVVSETVAVKAGSHVYITFASDDNNASLLSNLAYSLVVESVM